MRATEFLWLLGSLLLCCSACKKDDDEPETEAPAAPVLQLTGITHRNVTGAISGSIDADDWRMDESFNATASGYFGGTHTGSLLATDTTNRALLYANPISAGLATLKFISPRTLRRVELAYVDNNAHLVATRQLIVNNDTVSTFLDLLSVGGLHDDSYYRLYYRCLAADSTIYAQGHGDFLMNN